MPNCWKLANVIPIFKKGDPCDINNYRPVSLLPCASKIMERIVFKHLYNYIHENNLISPHQSGFKPGDSTVNQLSFLYHTFCEALDKKKDVHIIFCDISKAFDRVWHNGLVHKLKKLGIHGSLLDWFMDYLSDRYQTVVIRGQSSEKGLIKAGVPQGSVLGPLLFLIYINDILKNIMSHIKLFADDTSLYIEIDEPDVAVDTLNTDLGTIQSWADQWLVKFSPTKTQLMTCSHRVKDHPDIIFSNIKLADVESHKHFGHTLSRNLTWTAHISSVLKSVSPMADVLKSLKYDIDRQSLETIYFSFIRPKLEYGAHIFDNCSKQDSDLLEKFQLEMARIVTGARKGTSHDLLYNEVSWSTLEERRSWNKLINFGKIVNHETPQYLQALLPNKVGDSRPASRYADNYILIKTRTESFKRSFIPSSVKLWNELPLEKRNTDHCRKMMKKDRNILYYEGPRSLNIKHAQLRMQCSKLNYHLFLLHVTDSPACACGNNVEDENHFLLHCPLFHIQRQKMFRSCPNDVPRNELTCNTLLFGSENHNLDTNKAIFKAVHTYISECERL